MNKLLSRYLLYYPLTYLKGERIYPLLKQKRDNQWKSKALLDKEQILSAQKIIQYAKQHSLFYNNEFENIQLSDIKTLESLKLLPTVTKNVIINQYEQITTNFDETYVSKTTGGSTGEPVSILKNINALAHERASTWRAYEWANIEVGHSQGRFWGVPHTKSDRIKATITDLIANRKRVNAFNLSNQSLNKYYKELSKFNPSYLYGYVSVIEALAKHIQENNLSPFKNLKSIITTSEVLYDNSRMTIQDAFNTKVFNEYGCGEVGSIAHECEFGNMHIMSDNLILESSKENELIVTDLHNFKMPLIRYRLGDFGIISNESCQCGRNFPILKHLFGRAYDFIRLENGQKIHPESVIYIFESFKKSFDVISQFQVIQSEISRIDLKIIPKQGWSLEKGDYLISLMQKNISKKINFKIEVVENLGREKSGKMRVVKSQFN
jgi:phenylacetate-CoA ligase